MAAIGPRKRLALDTNLLLDLAEERDWAHEFRERFQATGYTLVATPTVFNEVAFASLYEVEPTRVIARKAIAKAREWGITSFEANSVQQGIAETFARRLITQRLLPPDEWNDALILAEVSLAEISLLVTSDKHLLDIDEDSLRFCFDEADLPQVHAVHPKRLLRALK
jgi:predicted nucleic acid-binding protein